MDCPSCGEGLQCVLCGADIPKPVPDEQAIERAAKYLFFGPYPNRAEAEWPELSAEIRQTLLAEARAVLAAALEQPER